MSFSIKLDNFTKAKTHKNEIKQRIQRLKTYIGYNEFKYECQTINCLFRELAKLGDANANTRPLYLEYARIVSDIEKKFVDRIMTLHPELTQQQASMINQTGAYDQFFEEVLLNDDLDQTVAEIEYRHKDIIKLEKSVQELAQLFTDFAILVDAQQDTLDNIEVNVNSAKNYTQHAEQSLDTAEKYQSKNRKCVCIMLLLFVLGMIALIMYFGIKS